MRISLFAIGVCFFTSVLATEYKWTGGGTAGSWTDPGNWNQASGYPGAGDMAVFDGAATITEDFTIGDGVLSVSNATSATLTFDCSISGEGGLSKFGDGPLHLKKSNPFKGKFTSRGIRDFKVDTTLSGAVYIYDGGAMGTQAAEFDQDYASGHGSRLFIEGPMTISVPVALSGDEKQQGNVCYENLNGGNVVFKGLVSSKYRYCDQFQPAASTGSVVFDEGLAVSPNWILLHGRSGMEYHIRKTLDMAATVRINYACSVHLGPLDTCKYGVLDVVAGSVVCEDENVLQSTLPSPSPSLSFRASTRLDLNGFDQKITNLASGKFVEPAGAYAIHSPAAKPAVLSFTGNVTHDFSCGFHGELTGAAGLEYGPSNAARIFAFSNVVSATRGQLKATRGTIVLTDSAGFTALSNITVAAEGRFAVTNSAGVCMTRELHVAEGGRLLLSQNKTIECEKAVFGEGTEPLPDGEYTQANQPDFISGPGRLIVDSNPRNEWFAAGDGEWNQGSNWLLGTPPAAGERVIIDGAVTVSLDESTPRLHSLSVVRGASLVVSNWTTCITADTVSVGAGSKITTPGAFKTANDAPASRVWIVCTDLSIASGGMIDVDAKGWSNGTPRGYGPGGPAATKAGASHGGYGSMPNVPGKIRGILYDDPFAPALPGSGACDNGSSTPGTAGGGAVRIEAAGQVNVDGSILASGGDVPWHTGPYTTGRFAGSGGSIWITCGTFSGHGGRVMAKGGDGDIGWARSLEWWWYYTDPVVKQYVDNGDTRAGGGGMIRIETGSGQSAASLTDMTVSAGAGIHRGVTGGNGALTVANHDKYRSEADLGTVTFNNGILLSQLLGKGLSGHLTGVTAYTHNGSLDWTSGHVRFPGTGTAGADVTIAGDLTLAGGVSRLEIGGFTSSTNRGIFIDRTAGTALNRLVVNGDLTLRDGAALDIRAAATNATMAWGGEVRTAGDLTVGAGSYLYPWCDIMNLGAPHFVVGGNFTVEAGATVMADRRGGMGGRGGSVNGPYFGLGKTSEAGYGAGRSEGVGASHGGLGGKGWSESSAGASAASGTPGALVPDEWTAAFPGAGGGATGYGEGGEGGGLVHVEALGDVTIDGLVTANGWLGTYTGIGYDKSWSGYCRHFGSGAGGGVHLFGRTFAGSGTISARGGNAIAGVVAGTDTAAGTTFGYGSGCGGGGRIVIGTGMEAAGKTDDLRYVHCDSADHRLLVGRLSFAGSFDVGGGTNVWNATKRTGSAVQFAACHGGEGTVRYVYVRAPHGTVVNLK